MGIFENSYHPSDLKCKHWIGNTVNRLVLFFVDVGGERSGSMKGHLTR